MSSKYLIFLSILAASNSLADMDRVDVKILRELEHNFEKTNKIEKENGKKSNNLEIIMDSNFPKKSKSNGKKAEKNGNFSLHINKKSKKFDVEEILNNAYESHKNGQVETASELYHLVLKKDNHNIFANLGLANIHQDGGFVDEAKKLYLKVLETNPSNQTALNNVISIIADESPFETMVYLKNLEKKYNTNDFFSAQIASISLKIKDYNQAIFYFKRAISKNPDNINYKYNLAVSYDLNNNKEEAIFYYKEVLEEYYLTKSVSASPQIILERVNFLLKN